MNERQKRLERNVLKYNARRAYFGKLTAAELDYAYGTLQRTQYNDKPVNEVFVSVGQIDGVVICRALWNEMSYNPLRFGTVSPFLYKGKENIYRFCDHPVPENVPGGHILETIRAKLIEYMLIIPNKDGGWNPDINPKDGWIRLVHGSSYYPKLTVLRKMMHIVASQNVYDFEHNKEYRAAILNVIAKRHPRGTRSNEAVAVPTPKPRVVKTQYHMTSEEIEEDRLEKEQERAAIDLHTVWSKSSSAIPPEQYEQAKEDYEQAQEGINAIMHVNQHTK